MSHRNTFISQASLESQWCATAINLKAEKSEENYKYAILCVFKYFMSGWYFHLRHYRNHNPAY